ncbi:MAG: Fmu (Sun) domain-containing protein [Bacteroidota bacterium]|nr:Fmu (Sun) domain-containing protein [Bacteroidota bacterium]
MNEPLAVAYLAVMSRFHSYINSAQKIIQAYKGNEPLALFLKKFFSVNQKYGSRDRKQVAHLCYCYFRQGSIMNKLPIEERILSGLFLCSDQSNEILLQLKPGWNSKISVSINEKLSLLPEIGSIGDIFPFTDELSQGINKTAFILSHLKQPDVFLRLRPGKEDLVKKKLKDAGIDIEIISRTCLAVANTTKIDEAIELDKEAVIQDLSSQRTGNFLQSSLSNDPLRISAWDCCAASGGKSIMLYDLYPHIELTVSDIRESILLNLKKRFREAGITNYKSFLADLTSPPLTIRHSPFDLILADVPCSGSGTWSRTPEQLYYFEKGKVNEYALLQKRIVANIIPHLKPGGYLFYITCSVFQKENEEVVQFMQQNSGLQLIKMEVLEGYDKKADTMFAALLRNPL